VCTVCPRVERESGARPSAAAAADRPFDEFKRIYDLAYDMRLKGCATFRPNPVTGVVLSEAASGEDAPHCCTIEREAD
jgi:ribonucleoside-diphosphate reductase alpha chain